MPSALAENVPLTRATSLSLPPAARMRSPLAGVLTTGFSTPCHSMPICLTPKSSWALTLKLERLGIEHDLLAGQILAGERGSLVVAAVDRQDERLLAGQAELVLPAELHRPRAFDLGRRAGDAEPRAAGAPGRQPGRLASSRLAVAVKLAVEPLTSETAPPRTSFC